MSKSSNQFQKPNSFIYFLFRSICRFLAKFKYNTKVIRDEINGVEGGYIIIANHESQIDFINITAALKRKNIMVISNSFYQTSRIKYLMDLIRVIPKQQFQTSPSDLKKMKRAVDNNYPLTIYPVGLMTENGMSTDPGFSTAKLLKFLKVDAYVCKTEGSYLSCPKWSKKKRKGLISLDMYKFLSKEEIASLSDKDVYDRIREAIDYNAYDNQLKKMIPYKNGDDIVGLEYVLYECPKCHQLKGMKSHDKSYLTCSLCGYEAKANQYGLLEGKDIIYQSPADWAKMIIANLQKEILLNPEYCLKDKVKIFMINPKNRKFSEVGSGEIFIDLEKIILSGFINDEAFNQTFNTKTYPILPFMPGRYLEVQDGQIIYRLFFDNPYNIMLFINILKIATNNI